jgi:hypothetical protein
MRFEILERFDWRLHGSLGFMAMGKNENLP